MNSDISIGQIVHYHPDENTRLAAIVVNGRNSNPTQELGDNPSDDDLSDDNLDNPSLHLDLLVIQPDGKQIFLSDISAIEIDQFSEEETTPLMAGKWSFPNSVSVTQNSNHKDLIHTNIETDESLL